MKRSKLKDKNGLGNSPRMERRPAGKKKRHVSKNTITKSRTIADRSETKLELKK
jgi:hypothetical protein